MLSAHSPHLHTQPPAKASLKAWWNHFIFIQRTKKEPSYVREYEKGSPAEHPVFGKPLVDSLKYASVPISTANHNGELYVWGYVPVVVAKCGLYLKENATEVPGTFRVNGSNKRMRELQQQFETPPKYGKNLNWKQETYTSHDVASVFRRYLTQMPEPVIPHRLYHKFRDALANAPLQNQGTAIAEYKGLIRQMSQAHQYLLLYVLDLLSVFARKCDKNLMTAQNLAVIFRPGILSHPSHEMLPAEHALSQRVLEFLIANQDWFMLDTPAPHPSLVTPPLMGPTSAPKSVLNTAHQLPPPSISNRGCAPVSPQPSQIGIHWRDIAPEKGEGGVPVMSEKDIQREQERLKVIRRRTTLERGEPGIYGTLEEPDMNSESPTISSIPPVSSSTVLSNGPATVTRSKTLPSSSRSRRSGGGGREATVTGQNPSVNFAMNTLATAPIGEVVGVTEKKEAPHRERSRLLKKQQKRSSMIMPGVGASGNQASQQQTQQRVSQILGGSNA